MCQLTFSDLKMKSLNRLYIVGEFFENSRTANNDGFGFFSPSCGIIKAEENAKIVINYGELTKDFSDLPVIGHVRQATAVNGKKTISKESSHPFEGEKIVLAHNGVLEPKEGIKEEYKGEIVDTVIFLKELEKHYVENISLPQALEETMKEFMGTFAFLIYSKVEKKFYVARGKTKKIYKSLVSHIHIKGAEREEIQGIVLNTDSTDLFHTLIRLDSVAQIVGKTFLHWTAGEEIKEETIFEIDCTKNELVPVGTIKENERKSFFPAKTESTTSGGKTTGDIKLKTGYLLKILSFFEENNLSLEELDLLLYISHGVGFLSATEPMVDYIIKFYEEKVAPFYTKEKGEIWKRICTYYLNPGEAYSYLSGRICFPYALNSAKELRKALNFTTNKFK